MKRNKYYWGRRLCLILIFILLMCSLPIQSAAERREYEVEKFQEKLIIPTSSLQTIDMNFQEGEELEFIYGIQVKEGLPIDVWFVNDENYNKFAGGGEFSYFIDGSEKNVIVDTKIVGVKEYNSYKLILANYNNQTVEIDIIYETRTYYADSSEDSSEEDSFMSDLDILLLIAVVILAVLLVFFVFKSRKYKRDAKPEVSTKVPSKKSKSRKASKQAKPTKQEAKPSKKSKSRKPSKQVEPSKRKFKPKVPAESAPGFCGYCGKPADTPFCKNCGREV